MATDNVYRLSVQGLVPVSGVQQNVGHYRLETAPTHLDFELAEDLCSQWRLALLVKLRSMMGTNVAVESISAERVTLTGGPTATLPINFNGTSFAECWDSALAYVISWIPGHPPYQRKLGKWFVFGIPDGALFENVWDNAYTISVADFASTYIVPIVSALEPANLWIPVIYDRTTKVAVDIVFEDTRPRPAHLKRRQRPYPV
jgi:hypothetical protein